MSHHDRKPVTQPPLARLLLSAPDRPGLVAAVAEFIYRHGGDVTQADQHNDEEEGMFFQRVEFRMDRFDLDRRQLAEAFGELGAPLSMTWTVRYSDDERRVGVLVSRQAHC
ncbi:MAG TPA: ACT domain-containing protein, partial [Acidimicrobiales bacterium]|nr:ACT domain-containing protein [Acidimicrobiales bacterium]